MVRPLRRSGGALVRGVTGTPWELQLPVALSREIATHTVQGGRASWHNTPTSLSSGPSNSSQVSPVGQIQPEAGKFGFPQMKPGRAQGCQRRMASSKAMTWSIHHTLYLVGMSLNFFHCIKYLPLLFHLIDLLEKLDDFTLTLWEQQDFTAVNFFLSLDYIPLVMHSNNTILRVTVTSLYSEYSYKNYLGNC